MKKEMYLINKADINNAPNLQLFAVKQRHLCKASKVKKKSHFVLNLTRSSFLVL